MNLSRINVLVCTGGGCVASGAMEVSAAFKEAIDRFGLDGEIRIIETGCLGPCASGPVAAVYPDGVLYQNLKPEHAEEIVGEHLLKGRVVSRLVAETGTAGQAAPPLQELSFFLSLIHI